MRCARSVSAKTNRRPLQSAVFKAVSTAADDADELEQLATLLKRNVQILKD